MKIIKVLKKQMKKFAEHLISTLTKSKKIMKTCSFTFTANGLISMKSPQLSSFLNRWRALFQAVVLIRRLLIECSQTDYSRARAYMRKTRKLCLTRTLARCHKSFRHN